MAACLHVHKIPGQVRHIFLKGNIYPQNNRKYNILRKIFKCHINYKTHDFKDKVKLHVCGISGSNFRISSFLTIKNALLENLRKIIIVYVP